MSSVDENFGFFGARLGVRGDNHLHHSGFAFVEAVEPCGALFERGNGRDDFVDLDVLAGEEVDAGGDFAGGSTGPLETELA